MFSLETLKIDLKSLNDSSLERNWELCDDYFEALEDAEIRSGKVSVCVSLQKTADSFALSIKSEGFVIVTCDRCLDDMEQPIAQESQFLVKLGIEDSEDDEVIVVDENEGILDLAWLIYESIALAVPIKHVHAPGKCNAAMTEKLNELSATRSGEQLKSLPNIKTKTSNLLKLFKTKWHIQKEDSQRLVHSSVELTTEQ